MFSLFNSLIIFQLIGVGDTELNQLINLLFAMCQHKRESEAVQ